MQEACSSSSFARNCEPKSESTNAECASELIIEAGHLEKHYWKDVWRYRELVYFLTWRDVLVRYKQTAIGIAWTVARPLLTMLVFTLVFGHIAKLPSPAHVPYSLLVFAGMLPWQFFATALSESSNSLISNSSLISKIYFPRLVVPLGSIVTSFLDFLMALVLMALLMGWSHFIPDWRLIAFPFFVALAFGAAFGAGLWLCALNVQYRDFRYLVPFLLQFGTFLSPVGFSSNVVPEKWRLLYSLNPMVGVIEGFRWSLFRGESPIDFSSLMTSTSLVAALSFSGVCYFRRTERTFADVI